MASPTPSDGGNFDSIDWDEVEKQDDELLSKFLTADPMDEEAIQVPMDAEVDQTNKAEDAEDFANISDDDLPDDEPATGPSLEDPGLTDDQGTSHEQDDSFDHLFQEAPSSPLDFASPPEIVPVVEKAPVVDAAEVELRNVNFPEFNPFSNQDPNIPAPPESRLELVKQLFPGFDQGILLYYNERLGPKPAHWIPKAPVKEPKILPLNKVSLDLALDDEKLFRTTGPARTQKRKRAELAEASGLVLISENTDEGSSVEEGFDYSTPADDEVIAGRTYADLKIICADWETLEGKKSAVEEAGISEQDPQDAWDLEFLEPAAKRKKTKDPDFFSIPQYAVPSFDNFLEDTARLGKRVYLDETDPYLLLEKSDHQNAPKRQRGMIGAVKRGKLQKSRFNYSNDDAYEALKENHQHKVRGTLGNLTVEHSMPAIRLQWPYYRKKLTSREARAYHRPSLKVAKFLGSRIDFSKPLTNRKRKGLSHLSTQAIFNKAEDLTLADHYSTATLFEYSEEHPNVLSNFGMGNRVINYYRRKDAEDEQRPQFDDKIGDSTVLLPEDQSPFSMFGMVDPGQTVRAIHNSLYRAPIFKHDPKHTDFLVIRNTTGEHGSSWHLRNIDNLFVVGQQLPLTEIPRPGARLQSSTDKNRVKMIAWRIMKKDTKNHAVSMPEVTRHTRDKESNDRQKLKEFLQYDKNQKVYRMRAGDEIPSEEHMRALVTPEILCVLDAMQVGEQYAVDAGVKVSKDETNEDESKDIEEQLQPWNTTKLFGEASSGKAMLQLHGEGDPSGCGLALSMLKVSMKGGYQGEVRGPNATSGGTMSAAERKANGGHTYNVKRQMELYQAAIRKIWEDQAANLSSTLDHGAGDDGDDEHEDEHDVFGDPHRSAASRAAMNDSMSESSDNDDAETGETGEIVRQFVNNKGQVFEETDIISDPRVWKAYTRRRAYMELSKKDVYDPKNMNTGDAEADRAAADHAAKELARLERNKARRLGREKAKKRAAGDFTADDAGSPSSTPLPTTEKASGTSRKCANCGQVGHIKTNKKYCPSCEKDSNSLGSGIAQSIAV